MINGGAMWMHIAHAVAILIFCGLKNNFCVKMNHFYCFSLGKGSNIMIFEKEGEQYITSRLYIKKSMCLLSLLNLRWRINRRWLKTLKMQSIDKIRIRRSGFLEHQKGCLIWVKRDEEYRF